MRHVAFAMLFSAVAALGGCQRETEDEAVGVTEPARAEADTMAVGELPAAQLPAAPLRDPVPPAGGTEPAPVLEGIPSKIPMPAEGTPTQPLAIGARVSYVCESGSELQVAYAEASARVTWTGGNTLQLSRTGSADGETYAGDGHTLMRVGNVVQFRRDDGAYAWRCAENAASA